jgi:hypothetical protein
LACSRESQINRACGDKWREGWAWKREKEDAGLLKCVAEVTLAAIRSVLWFVPLPHPLYAIFLAAANGADFKAMFAVDPTRST